MLRSITTIAAAGALVLGAAACSSSGDGGGKPGDSSPIVIGNIGAYSGPLASSVIGAKQTIEAWAKWTNAHGGIRGHQVKLIVKDEQNNPTTAVAAVKELIEKDKVVAIVGERSSSDETWAKYADAAGVPVIGGQLIDTSFLTDPNFFATGANILATIYGMLEQAKATGGPFAFLYCAESPRCASSGPLYKAMAQAVGVDLPVLTKISATAPDYTSQCLALKNAGVTSYQIGSSSEIVFRVAKACEEQGVKAINVTSGGALTASWAKEPAVNGTVSVDDAFPFTDDSTPATKEYQQAKAKYAPNIGGADGPVAAGAWVAGKLFQAAVAAAPSGPITPDSVRQGLYALKGETLGGLTAPLTFTKGKPTLINCYFVTKVADGKITEPQGMKTSCAPDALIAKIAAGLH